MTAAVRYKGISGRSIRRHVIFGLAIFAVLSFGIGGWAMATSLSGAVIASGRLVVDSHVKKVQHQTGGIVGELRVQEGAAVIAGQIVLRLDDTQTRTNLAIVTRRIGELGARLARLRAERDESAVIDFSEIMRAKLEDLDLPGLMAGERKLFEARRAVRLGKKAQLHEQIKQLELQTTGILAQETSKAEEIKLVNKQLVGLHTLWDKNLVEYTKVVTIEREAARLNGERGQLIATFAQAKGKSAEIQLQIIQVDQDLQSDVAKEISEVEAQVGEFSEKRAAALEELKRIDVRAPQDGVVKDLNVHAKGAVISAAEQIMVIVPVSDNLVIEAKVVPDDIDQLTLGQPATVRFSAFNQRTTPQLNGRLSRISADLNQDEKTGQMYYVVRITTLATEVERLGNLKLVPGMPVEVFLRTDDRTVLSYLMKPISDQINRAFREQ